MDQTVDGFAPLRVKRVVRETADAVSLVFDVPEPLSQRFHYQPGQFLTLRVQVDGQEHRRCYSMSSSPMVADDLRITVKRDPGGVVSNWLNDTASPGDEIHAAPPEGRFVLGDSDRELVAFAGGSRITPVYSLIRSALAVTPRRVRLFYANRSSDSVIFADSLARLAEQHPDRLLIHHHLDEDSGVVQPEEIKSFVADAGDAEFYLCGPREFMDTVEDTVLRTGVATDRIHLERFDVVDASVAAATVTEEVTIRLDRRTTAVPYRAGNTVLQTARLAGLQPPSSCETGSCGTCMARLVEGSVRMINNDALTEEEVAEGWVLTCQSLPITRTLKVVYE
ncbi:ferredoxin--NADP reductase [Mycobacterium noviomagense]|nr:ferredoxin--NADP reductase [Mycobacterium noviomagense]ORB17764.1 ferredoxin [Mycobacterium noviomagense]